MSNWRDVPEWYTRPVRWLRRQFLQRVLVHSSTGQTFEGLLAGSARDGLVLRAVTLLDDGGGKVPLSGEIFVPREKVLFLQRIGHGPLDSV